MALRSECEYVFGEDSVPFSAWDAITKLLNIFKDDIGASNWYTLALCDEYAALAREQIHTYERTELINEFTALTGYMQLSNCEKRTIQYQAVINHLGNNLQCVASAALVSSTFFVNLKPIINDMSSDNLKSWLQDYNHQIVRESIFEQLEKQPICVNRMLHKRMPYMGFSMINKSKIRAKKYQYVPSRDNQSGLNEFNEKLARESHEILEEHLCSNREVSI